MVGGGGGWWGVVGGREGGGKQHWMSVLFASLSIRRFNTILYVQCTRGNSLLGRSRM